MEILAITLRGLEHIAAAEIVSFLPCKPIIYDTAVQFSLKDPKEIYALEYQLRSINRLLVLVHKQELSGKQAYSEIDIDGLSKWLIGSFKVVTTRLGDHDFDSQEVNIEVGARINEQYKCPVSLENPESIVHIYINNKDAYICIDVTKLDLSKRPYKLFSNAKSIKGTFAYGMLAYADYCSADLLVDPFCGSGEIVIEAALKKINKSVFFYNKSDIIAEPKILEKYDLLKEEGSGKIYAFDSVFNSLQQTKKNAKIAGVHSEINYSRINLEWLDTKFKKSSVNKIVTQLPCPSHRHPEIQIKKIYDEFLYQSQYILSKEGIIVVALNDKTLFSDRINHHNFRLLDHIEVYTGKKQVHLLKLVKGKDI